MGRKKTVAVLTPVTPEEAERLKVLTDDVLEFEIKRRRAEKAEALDGEIVYVKSTIRELEDQLATLKGRRRELENQKSKYTKPIYITP